MRPVILAMALTMFAAAAAAQEAIRTRAVRIIEGGAATNQTQAPPPAPAQPTAPPVISDAEQRASNPAGIRVELLPGTEVAVGERMSVRVTADKPGYLVVVDVDSAGRLTQIYPNTHSLADPKGAVESANLVAKGKWKVIPDPREKSSFEFVAAAPLGVGMLVAILSDKPVQMIDLPDVPAEIAGLAPALDYVRDTTRTLKILPASDTGKIVEPHWSFATKFYVIR